MGTYAVNSVERSVKQHITLGVNNVAWRRRKRVTDEELTLAALQGNLVTHISGWMDWISTNDYPWTRSKVYVRIHGLKDEFVYWLVWTPEK